MHGANWSAYNTAAVGLLVLVSLTILLHPYSTVNFLNNNIGPNSQMCEQFSVNFYEDESLQCHFLKEYGL